MVACKAARSVVGRRTCRGWRPDDMSRNTSGIGVPTSKQPVQIWVERATPREEFIHPVGGTYQKARPTSPRFYTVRRLCSSREQRVCDGKRVRDGVEDECRGRRREQNGPAAVGHALGARKLLHTC